MMEVELNDIEARIVGCLIEKENTTPDYYPLTLNALTNACNQKSNRNPVVSYSEETVEQALESLLAKDVVYLFYGSGSRTPKYKHLVPRILNISHPETAVLCVLLLRGPQTLGELNQRTSRIYSFSGLDQVNETVEKLIRRDEPLLEKLSKQPGQKEARFAHLLSGEVKRDTDDHVVPEAVPSQVSKGSADLAQKVEGLRKELDELREEFEEFKRQFD